MGPSRLDNCRTGGYARHVSESAAPFTPLQRAVRRLGAPIAWLVLRPMRVPSLLTPRSVGLSYRAVRLQGEGASLAAWHIPCEGSRAGLVLCHGHNNCRQQLLSLLRPLHQAGFHLLLFDFRSHGVSGGRICTYGFEEQKDVRAAVSWLREQAGVDEVGLYGISMGGSTALMAAAEDPQIRAVATDCAFARLEDMVQQRFFFLPPSLREPLGASVRECAERWVGPVIPTVDPEAAVRGWKPRPLLVIHGERDMLTPASHGERLARAGAPHSHLWIVPWAPHAGSRWVAGAEYLRRLTGFFREHLPAAG